MQLKDIPTAQPVELFRDELWTIAHRLNTALPDSYDLELLHQQARRIEQEFYPEELWLTPGKNR